MMIQVLLKMVSTVPMCLSSASLLLLIVVSFHFLFTFLKEMPKLTYVLVNLLFIIYYS